MTVDVGQAEKLLDQAQDMIRNGRPGRPATSSPAWSVARGGRHADAGASGCKCTASASTRSRAARGTDRRGRDRVGEHRQAVTTAEQWVAAAPLDERAHRALIGALDAAGDRAGAVRAYEACRTLLADELGVDPTRETVEVYLHALGDQPPVAGAGTACGDQLPRPRAGGGGRGCQLRGPGLVTVVGPAGVGKSRVAAEVALALHAKQVREVRWVPLEVGDRGCAGAGDRGAGPGWSPGDDAVASIVGELAPYGPLVLVLDGGEAALDGAATCRRARARVRSSPLLATSRIPLGLQDERRRTPRALVVPGPRGRRRPERPGLELLLAGPATVPHRSDGPTARSSAASSGTAAVIPLAIELVAAAAGGMAPGDLADQLDELLGSADDPVRGVAAEQLRLLSEEEASGLPPVRGAGRPDGLSLATEVVSATRCPGCASCASSAAGGVRAAPSRPHDRAAGAGARTTSCTATPASCSPSGPRSRRRSRAWRPPCAACCPTTRGRRREPYADPVTDMLPSVRSLLRPVRQGRADPRQGLELAFRLHRYWAATNVGEGSSGWAGCWKPRNGEERTAALRDLRARLPGVLVRRQRTGDPAPRAPRTS